MKNRFSIVLVLLVGWTSVFGQNNYEPEPPTPRPKIGLVLSGGGAKGSAHIGVLKALEELQIPIDYIVGTSMGSIMAGMYSIGYTSEELDSLISNLDWSVILSNEGEWKSTTYDEKRLKEKFLFSIPFKGTILNPKFEEKKSTAPKKDGYNLFSDMPSGVFNGQNVMDLFKSLTIGYQGHQNFDSLPIPFACVAADITRNEEVVLHSGELSEAIRASMAIPGVFEPVKHGDTVLCDGGVMNNYPADVAIDMGADIIIGVHLGIDLQPAEKLDNMLGIFSQLFGILLHNKIDDNIRHTDFMIYPNIEGFNMLSFSKKNVAELVERGYEATMEQRDFLLSLRDMLDSCGYDPCENDIPPDRHARNANVDTFAINTITFTGEGAKYTSMLGKLVDIEIKPNTRVAGSDIREAVSALYSSAMFDKVDYQLLGSQEPYDLVFNLEPSSSHSLSVGARFDLEEYAQVLLSFSLNRYRLYTPKIATSLVLGLNPSIDVELSYPLGRNLKVAANDQFSGNNFRMFSPRSAMHDINFNYNTLQVYMSTSSFRNFLVEVGAEMDNFFVKSFSAPDKMVSGSNVMTSSNFLDAFLNVEYNPKNNTDLTSNGLNLKFITDYYFLSSLSDFYHFATVQLNLSWQFNLSPKMLMNTAFFARSIFSRNVPALYGNIMGGLYAGRYVEHQIPFIGLNYADFFEKNLTVYRVDLRYKLFERQYVTLMTNYAVHTHDIKDYFYSNDAFGVCLSYTYDIPIIGPATVLAQWSTTHGMSWMFSLGFFF